MIFLHQKIAAPKMNVHSDIGMKLLMVMLETIFRECEASMISQTTWPVFALFYFDAWISTLEWHTAYHMLVSYCIIEPSLTVDHFM